MSTTSYFIALAVCLLLIVASIYFISRQLKLNKQRADRIQAGEQRLQEERAKRVESVRILMQAIEEDDKLTWTEVAIRVKNLLDQLSIDLSEHESVSAIYVIEQNTQHIPTHDQWNELPLKARRKYRDEMDALEAKHLEQLRQAKIDLLAYKFD
ncbi:hypothetical protein MGA5115_01269 [Marinomonas gallaica]|uniref:DUF2489 domain-containing protein n=1 Tax=Marinomonas gallaica TaxID=1806667 RepID=A0A1C3JPX6_9GAMM|nr:DUF2489 domain-containing protein [Marinomonas gallaica]SBT17167.1 hypothetical protein MGA5115_01269 [Marinomonas gallaica]SBT19502.1 hypothetical protein MGA5116_00068 [Marinomonas gallaica]